MANRPRPPVRALGLSHKARSPSSRRLASVLHEALRRASPAENVRMGYSPKARRYVKAGAKVTKATASVSARHAETKRVRKVYGFATLEGATEARRHGALSYESAAQGQRVAKANQTRLFRRVERAGENREKIPYNPAKHRQGTERRTIRLKTGDGERYRDLRRRRLRGEWLEIVDFVWLMDVGQHFSDPQSALLRQSPDARGPEFFDGGDDDMEDAA
jgi:hypothetical protein